MAPCTGMLTCFTVGKRRSRAAPNAVSLARSCGRVSGRTVNKAMGPPSGSDEGTGVLPAAVSPTGKKGRAARGLDDTCADPRCGMQRTVADCMPARGAQGAVMAYAWGDHLGGPDRHIPERDACWRRSTAEEPRRASRREARRYRCRPRKRVRHRIGVAGCNRRVGFGLGGLLHICLVRSTGVLRSETPRRRSATGVVARTHQRGFPLSSRMAARCGHVSCFGRVGLLRIACCLPGSRESHDRRVLCGRDERDPDWFRPQGAYSQSSGLYAFRQARSTGLCIGVAASSRATRPQAEWP